MLESFESAGLGWFWSTDAKGRITYLSTSCIEEMEWNRDGVFGHPLSDLVIPDEGDVEIDGKREVRPLSFLLGSRNAISQLIVQVAGSDPEIWWELAGNPHFDRRGEFVGYRGSARDVTARISSERQAARLTRFDPLTKLPNRNRLRTMLGQVLTKYRNAKRSCSLIVVGLDRFKHINDTLGHKAGDELLEQVAARLLRIFKGHGEVARLGSDEFAIMLPDIDDRGELGEFGNRIIQLISQPYSINGSRAIIGTSVGFATAPYDGVDTDELLKAADLALSDAKAHGRGRYRFYSTELADGVKRRRQIEEDLRDAIASKQLVLHYQPIVDASTHDLKCLEALMRWEHPERGMISPGVFIPIAEDIGLIKQMGDWALEHACVQAVEWPGELRVAVNVSAIQFMDEGFPQVVERALRQSGLKPDRLELEITESVFMGDHSQTQRKFRELKALGVRLALDDFGTGYSSLSYLRHAPFDKIKIDQSFVRGATEADNNNSAIISSIISLAAALNMETVAEGVETQDELKLVTEKGASHLQGRIFSFAISHEELLKRIANHEFTYEPCGPDRYRADRRTEYRRIGLVHDDHRYSVVLRNLSKTGALVEGLLDVPVGVDVVLDLGGGQLAVATVRRSHGISQGLEFETPLISDGADGLCTRHRVSPYQIEAAGRPLRALSSDPYAMLMAGQQVERPKAFREVEIGPGRSKAA
ncbi:EAL domain-containing protein [Altererythrobacter arenosus]|uniref:EAL domain-containing protein n=1 Tax=Altererythrobacter arenosus TaxID=3032592 RepID=A0ABY8FP90_9SPHN|nr:EAL domain-containing protein [Altererythrobacter sp. CAU 1644]WFL76824.1 EAL domain-containing protein [Altererythrobacter sp. CAU 1644]